MTVPVGGTAGQGAEPGTSRVGAKGAQPRDRATEAQGAEPKGGAGEEGVEPEGGGPVVGRAEVWPAGQAVHDCCSQTRQKTEYRVPHPPPPHH